MSAPKTNIERQKNRHRPVLIGIAGVLIFAAVVFLFNMDAALEDADLVDESSDVIVPEATD